jgi:hypothetical protein
MARHFTSMSKQKAQNASGDAGCKRFRAAVKYIDQTDKYLDRAASAPFISRQLRGHGFWRMNRTVLGSSA